MSGPVSIDVPSKTGNIRRASGEGSLGIVLSPIRAAVFLACLALAARDILK